MSKEVVVTAHLGSDTRSYFCGYCGYHESSPSNAASDAYRRLRGHLRSNHKLAWVSHNYRCTEQIEGQQVIERWLVDVDG